MASINIDINNKETVKLEPDIIYRVGRRLGLEFSIDDESVELAHATIVLVAGGVVRLAAVNGDVFVNGIKAGQEIKGINEADAINGLVDLRFGKVTGKLRFNDAKRLHHVEANDSSGFGEVTRGDRSTNVTDGSFNIPESEPQSANNTGIADSFVIPETQAFCIDRPARISKQPKTSLGDDFMIPETQDIVLNASNNPIQIHQDLDIISEDDCSEFGTQIRICTQDFNEFNEDAIDDFDSSLILGNGGLDMQPPAKQTNDNTVADPDMSALNWSASNSKCTALNSTKADDLSSRGDICLTPDLSLTGKSAQELRDDDDDDCTPDIFDMRQSPFSPNLKLPANVLCSPSTTKAVDKQNELVVVSMQTPDSIPAELLNSSQDFIATQAFPARTALTKNVGSNTNDDKEDFIETHAFPKRMAERESSTSDDALEDLIATQAFVRPRTSLPKSQQMTGMRLSITAQIHSHNEDFIETQAFAANKTNSAAISNPRLNLSNDNLDDYIATQAFIKPSRTPGALPNKSVDTILNITAKIGDITDDMLDTQLFIPPALNTDKASVDKKNADCLKVPNSIKMGDELDKDLSQLIGLSSSDEDEPHSVEQDNNTVRNNGNKSPQSKELPNKSVNIQKDQQHVENSRKRSSSRSESPEVSPCKKPRIRQLSKSSASSEAEHNKVETTTIEKRLKRSSTDNADPLPKKTRGRKAQLTAESTSDATAQKTKEVRPRGRPRGSKNLAKREDPSSEEKTAEDSAKKQIEAGNDPESKTRKSRKENDSSDDKPVVKLDIQPISRRTRRQSQFIENIVEENGKEIAENSKEESHRAVKASTETDSTVAKKGKAKAEATEPKSKNDEGTQEVSSDASVKRLRSSSKSSLETIEDEMQERPTTSSTARRMNARRSKLSSRNPLTEINDYIKKIKRSGKLRLALSMCNLSELNPVLASLKNAIEVTNDPVESDLVIMDRGERTYKFLVGVAGNKPILSPKWLHAMKKTCSIVVESDHIFKDDKFEKTFKFKPLSVFANPSLLKGVEFILGENIQPTVKDMKAIIQCAGGTVHTKVPSIASKIKLYAIATKNEKHVWPLLRNYKNVKYISTEGVMQALVQHNLELLDEHKINLLDISK